MSRILFVGDLNGYSRSTQRLRALRELGHAVTAVSDTPIGIVAGVSGAPSLWYRIRYKLGYPIDLAGANEEVIRLAGAEDWDMLWVEKTLAMRPATLRAVKQLRPRMKLVSFPIDNVAARTNRSAYYLACLPLYDVIVTAKSRNARPEELPAMGARDVVLLPHQGFDPLMHRPVYVSAEDRERLGADVGFIGTYERSRADSLLYLAQHGISVRVWGNDWHRMKPGHELLRVEGRPVYGDDYAKALCATRINLCFLRKLNQDLQTDRSLEIPACGAFMLAERSSDHLRMFSEGVEAAYFDADRPDELLAKVRYFLLHEEERRAVAAAGQRRCLESGYSHRALLDGLVEKITGETKIACAA